MLQSTILKEKLYQKILKEVLQIQTIKIFRKIQKRSLTGYKSLGLKNLNTEKTSSYIPIETVKNRLAYVQALEAARALEENILLSVEEGDVGGILGWGCLIWAGGPFSWLDYIGHENVVV